MACCCDVRITGAARPERAERVERASVSGWIVIAVVVYTCWWAAVPAPLSIVLLAILVIVWLAFAVLRQSRTLQDAAVDLVAPIYIGAPLGMLVALQMLSGPRATLLLIATVVVSDTAQYSSGRAFGPRRLALLQMPSGHRATLLLIATVVVSDTAQYYSGRAFGRRPLAPAISPHKTVQGDIGGVVCGGVL